MNEIFETVKKIVSEQLGVEEEIVNMIIHKNMKKRQSLQ